ncbi:MAG: guanylate kinase, partial [Christensenellales bacterium]
MILVLSGSSCCGKNTVIKELINQDESLKYINTFTSREKRVGESDGNPYFFISKEEFQQKIKNGDFFEHELIHNNFYGVEKNLCKELIKQNKHLLKDMGVIGTFNLKEQLKENFVETVYLYVSKHELKKRLKNRG